MPDPTITGTSAGEVIPGTAGPDVISAGGGLDVVHGYDGDDTITGGANRDRLYGDEGNDIVFGNGSEDKLWGGAGDDTVDGGDDDDRVYGGDGSDIVVGGDGNDVLYGDSPDDGFDAEGFADIFRFDAADGSDKVFDFEHGIDKVELTSGGTYSLAYAGPNTILTYGTTTVTFYDEVLDATDVVLI
jgi:Ca2+-binding RTX toxin-like protein